jgi:hypothetical protein
MIAGVTRIVAALLAVTVLASCADRADSDIPTHSGAIASSTPEASATETEVPSASPTAALPSQSPMSSAPNVTAAIEVGDVLHITGDGLAVRAGPGSHHPLVSEYLLGTEDPIETTLLRHEVRLPAGHFVMAVVGPIVVDETTWYAVANVPQDDGQTWEDTPIWRSVAPVPYSEIDFQLTWIAIAQSGATFVEVTDRSACPACYGDWPQPTAVASGVGEGRVGPWPNTGVASITIAAAAPVSTATCAFTITNPTGEPMFFDEAALDYVEGFVPGVSPGTDDEVWLDVTGDCAWAIKVSAAEG